ncbi:protein mono-ADP-ribosyltransferase PARP4-like [Rhinichthys klamathensis goyatoka]|uniref:protein mono-ADP-ribosyltransferase PARP4-like n=1 Tax=Rhinichthys klamathensis goyatoka TaxID=3034132 RepID=UPI0024B625C0|nr:protein mono-ADP-ribosyltransferase PARP4-like [Rhinichthys klamathensis goyatoka]
MFSGIMTVFENCTVVLDVKNVPYKEKKNLKSALLENGGNISYVINKECSFVVTSSVNDLSSNRQRSIQKLRIPVVGTQYVWCCLDEGHLLPLPEHDLAPQLAYPTSEFISCPEGKVSTQIQQKEEFKDQPELSKIEIGTLEKGGPSLSRFRFYRGGDHELPEFPSHFQVAKYSVFEQVKPKTLSVLELQSARGRKGQQYRVLSLILHEAESAVVQDKLVYCVTSEDAVEAYLLLMKEMETQGFTRTHTLPPEVERLASYSLQQLLLEEKLNCSSLSQQVGVFVELVWTEALGSLSDILTVPVSRISLNDVSRVEGLLLQAQKTQKEDEVKALLEEVNTLLPLRMIDPPSKHKLVSQKLDLCQLIRDILNVSEATLGSPSPSSLGKYRALRCSIEVVPPQNPEFHVVSQLLHERPVQIQQILRVSRGVELQMFWEDIGNIKPLLHSTSPSSFVGILSRGLLLPRVGVEQHGIERTDIGNLGGGIYFSDSLNTSVKYSKPSVTDGSRLLLVCEVALGRCKDLLKKDTTLTCAPDGYHSVHGVHRTPNRLSEFEDDEFVVYNTEQIRLKYVVQYTLEGDELKEFQPHINTVVELTQLTDTSDVLSSDDSEGLESTKNPLEEMTAGLLDSNGQKIPLQAVNVRCKLMDLLCQVIIFQTYTNKSAVPIEAKYVFPLEETAAVCGFEAFINGKHVVGKVKEKEQARKEYKQAIEKGHGAYLMDQDAPDVFTISVGNLPPGATVLIKVTFITELVVRSGSIVFSLAGSVAPWQQSAALNMTTQTTVEKIGVTELQSEGEFSLSMSIEMPYEIINLSSSHRIKTKMTDCKAVVSTLPGQTLGSEGLQVSFSLSNIHMPRMWVENHPDKYSQACMLVFYPDFKSSGVSSSGDPSSVSDVVILLDSSKSMRGDAMLNARRIALQVLKSLDRSLKINIISFSTDYKEAFPAPVPLDEASEPARKFIMSCSGAGGGTELWRPLQSLSLLSPCRGVRNILLLSDGHVQNQPLTLQLVRENSCHTRLFTCGLSLTANRHMLRALAQAGGGTCEFFDTKMKHTWAEKVRAQVQRMESPGCRSVAVKWQQFNPTAPPPVQAPSQLHGLFSDCHTLIYGFVPHCTQATLFGDLSGNEIKTMVSTTELQKTKGTFLHKLTARAIIRDYEDGILGNSEAEHEGKKAELKSYIIELSKEFSILSQFTSFVAIEERDQNEPDAGLTDIPKLISEEDVDILPYMGWTEEKLMVEHIICADDVRMDSEEWRSSGSTSLILHSSARKFAFDDDENDSEDDYEDPIEDFIMEASAALPRLCSSSSWRPSRFEGSIHGFRLDSERLCSRSSSSDVSYSKPQPPPPPAAKISALMDAPSPVGHVLLESVEPTGGVSMSDRLPPPTAASMPLNLQVPCYYDSVESLSSNYNLASQTDVSPIDASMDAPLPHHIRHVLLKRSMEPRSNAHWISPRPSGGARSDRLPPPTPPPPASKGASSVPPPLHISASADSLLFETYAHGLRLALGLEGSTPPLFAGPPPNPSLASNLFLSSIPTPPAPLFGRPSASFSTMEFPALRCLSEIQRDASTPPLFAGPPPNPSLASNLFLSSSPTPPAPLFGRPSASFSTMEFPALRCLSEIQRDASTPPLFDGPPFPPRLASKQDLSPTPSFAPAFFRRVDASFCGKAAGPAVFGYPTVSTPPSLPASSGFGCFLQSTNEPLGFLGSSSSGLYEASHQKQTQLMQPKAQQLERQKLLRPQDTLTSAQCKLEATKRAAPRFQLRTQHFTKPHDILNLSVTADKTSKPDTVAWKELFELQHEDGYWECTERLSSFLNLDVDFFANVFLQEKGIRSFGVKAHAEILRLVATLLVLQLIRVKKLAVGQLLESLLRLKESQEPRPMHWEAVKRAVDWACRTDRQYPCVCSRLEIGRDWESSTRQLLGCDSPHPYSPLKPVLERRACVSVM